MRIEKKQNETHFWLASGEDAPVQQTAMGGGRIVIFRSGSENLQKTLANLLNLSGENGK